MTLRVLNDRERLIKTHRLIIERRRGECGLGEACAHAVWQADGNGSTLEHLERGAEVVDRGKFDVPGVTIGTAAVEDEAADDGECRDAA